MAYQTDPIEDMIHGLKTGNPRIVGSALAHGADPNAKLYISSPSEFFYPLYVALAPDFICSSTFEIVKELISNGADVNGRTSNGGNAMCLAAQSTDARLIKLLIDAGGDANMIGEDGTSPLYQTLAAEGDDNDVKKELIEAGADVNFVAPDGNTILIAACGLDKPNFVELLIESGAKIFNGIFDHINYPNRPAPLEIAVKHGNRKVVKVLLEHDALKYDDDDNGYSRSLSLAYWIGNNDIAKLLESYGADLPSESKQSMRAFGQVFGDGVDRDCYR